MRVSGAVALALLLLTPAAPARAAAPDDTAYYWRWSDGSEATSRTLPEPHYSSRTPLPRLIVTSLPSTPRQRITLEFLDGTRWRVEDEGWTNRSGVARLELNPYCANGAWCAEAFRYRLVAGGRTTAFTVRYMA